MISSRNKTWVLLIHLICETLTYLCIFSTLLDELGCNTGHFRRFDSDVLKANVFTISIKNWKKILLNKQSGARAFITAVKLIKTPKNFRNCEEAIDSPTYLFSYLPMCFFCENVFDLPLLEFPGSEWRKRLSWVLFKTIYVEKMRSFWLSGLVIF